jgi:hypothetical protein
VGWNEHDGSVSAEIFWQKEFWIDGIHGHEQRWQRHELKIGVLTMVTQMLLYERLF